MNEEILLSVIIPVYNTEKYLSKCLESVIVALKNIDAKSEIIIVNDGSKDNSEKIILEYKDKYKDLIRYYKKENAGLADTKNVGINYSKGKYLSFIDSDDYIDENFYSDAVEYITKKDVDVVIYDWETIDIKNNTKYIVPAKNDKYDTDKWGCIDVSIMPSSCNKIVKKCLFEGLEFPVGLRYEDLGTTLIVLLKAKNIKYINKPYYKYCLTPNSIMRVEFDERNLQMIDIFNILYDRLSELPISLQDKERCIYMVYTRRLYEEILEKISISKLFRKSKRKICYVFCDKIHSLEPIIYRNKYFEYNVFGDGIVKKISNKFLYFIIRNKKYNILSILLNSRIYYRCFSIKYSGKECIDSIEREEKNVKNSSINTLL